VLEITDIKKKIQTFQNHAETEVAKINREDKIVGLKRPKT